MNTSLGGGGSAHIPGPPTSPTFSRTLSSTSSTDGLSPAGRSLTLASCFVSNASDIVGPVNRRHVTMLVENRELESAQAGTQKEYGDDLVVFERNGADIKNKMLGNFTFMYSALYTCASELMHARYRNSSRWIILLCDGDDSGGGRSEASCRELLRSCCGELNLVIISVGSDVTRGSVLQSFADAISHDGGVGKYIAAFQEQDESQLQDAFAQVEESLLLVGGGQTEAGCS